MVSPRGATRATTVAPARSGTSGSCVRSSSVCDRRRPVPSRLQGCRVAADDRTEWTVVSTSPPPACSPSRSARTRSPTTWRTRRRPATRPTARRSSRSASCCSPTRHRRDGRLAEHGGPGRQDRRPTSPRSPSRTPASRSTSRSSATASSPSRPPQGTRYTRNGQFTLDAQGRLVTAAGRPGARPRRPPITVGADGTVDPRRSTSCCSPTRSKAGRQPRHRHARAGAGQTGARSAPARSRAPAPTPTRSMVDMIASLRAFEAGQKVIQTIDETLGKAANHVGSIAARRRRAQVSARLADDRGACSKDSTPPRPAWQPSSSASTPSPTTSPTRTRPATSTCASASATSSTTRPAARPPRARAPAPARPPSTPAAPSPRARCSAPTSPLDVAIQGEGFLARQARRRPRRR